MKTCSHEGCERPFYSRNFCKYHYHVLYKKGLLETRTATLLERGRFEDHPYYHRWGKIKAAGNLSEEWQDFWQFVDDIGEKPKIATKLQRLDRTKPIGRDNFKWSQPLEGERKNAYYRDLDKNSKTYRNNRLKKYGITGEQYDSLLEEQDYKCAICKREETKVIRNGRDESKRRLSVDHCHKTGKVRGLLCGDCNPGLGSFQDSVETLANAILYLQKYQD